jgi:hypothetical protein
MLAERKDETILKPGFLRAQRHPEDVISDYQSSSNRESRGDQEVEDSTVFGLVQIILITSYDVTSFRGPWFA